MKERPQRPKERIPGIPNVVLNAAVVEVAGEYNQDLKVRTEEVIGEGGDALLLISSAFSGAGKKAIELARQMRRDNPNLVDEPEPEPEPEPVEEQRPLAASAYFDLIYYRIPISEPRRHRSSDDF